jgi:predicted nucleic-acid-binding protein
LIGIDTNILARAILQDDPKWTPVAQRFLSVDLTADAPGYVNLVTLVELIWTLGKSRQFNRTKLSELITSLLAAENLIVERPDLVTRALAAFEAGGAGFADYLIAELNAAAGATHTVTIDGKAGSRPMFQPLT